MKSEAIDMVCNAVDPLQTFRTETVCKPRCCSSPCTLPRSCERWEKKIVINCDVRVLRKPLFTAVNLWQRLKIVESNALPLLRKCLVAAIKRWWKTVCLANFRKTLKPFDCSRPSLLESLRWIGHSSISSLFLKSLYALWMDYVLFSKRNVWQSTFLWRRWNPKTSPRCVETQSIFQINILFGPN